MKANFLTRLNTWLFVVPVLLILGLYFGIGLWFYISGATYVLKDFHSAQLITMLSDKKTAIDLWIDVRKKALDEIAGSGTVTDSLQALAKGQSIQNEGTAGAKENKSTAAATEAGQKLAKYMEGLGQFKEISILSPEGKVIWSTDGQAIGREWADKEIIGKASAAKPDLVSGRTGLQGGPENLLFTAPLAAEGQELKTLIVAQPNPADLAASLKVEKGFYETGKVSIIDTAGNVVAARDITDVGKVRYNIRQGNSEEVGYRDGLYYSVTPLKSGRLRLIATLDAAEAAKPLKPLTTVYLSFAGLIVLVILLQCFLVAPRLLEKPLAKLVKATQSIAEEDMRVNLRKGYSGELRMLAEGFSQMIVGLSRKRAASGRDHSGEEGGHSKAADWGSSLPVIKGRLDAIATALEASAAGMPDQDRRIEQATVEIKCLAADIADLNLFIRLREDSDLISKKEVRACELLSEIEGICRGLLGEKEVELIVECPENIAVQPLPVDRQLFKMLCSTLLRNSIRNTEVGTITLLPTILTRDGIEYLGLAVSDTGRGLDQKQIERIMKKDVMLADYIELCIARAAVGLLGGRMTIESIPGNGTLVTAGIPISGPAATDPNPAAIS